MRNECPNCKGNLSKKYVPTIGRRFEVNRFYGLDEDDQTYFEIPLPVKLCPHCRGLMTEVEVGGEWIVFHPIDV